ncbi:MAG: SCO family protein [Rhodovibrionaceae bacterium]
MKLFRLTAWLLVALLGLGAAWLWLERWQGAAPDQSAAVARQSFELVDQNGETVSAEWFREGPLLVFFGFTHCPDVCPTTLARVSGWLDSLDVEARGLKPVFVSVDPERDSPALLKAYLAHFDPRITGLTGAPEDLRGLAGSLGAQFSVEQVDGRYEVAHSPGLYLLDRQGRFVGSLKEDTLPEIALERLRGLLREGRS